MLGAGGIDRLVEGVNDRSAKEILLTTNQNRLSMPTVRPVGAVTAFVRMILASLA
jgi:hypothetical protein